MEGVFNAPSFLFPKPSCDNKNSVPNSICERVVKDFQECGQFVWVTNGRTIENYIPEDIYLEAVKASHPKKKLVNKPAKFANITKLDGDATINKVAVARAIIKNPPDFSMLDLEKQLNALIGSIKKANA